MNIGDRQDMKHTLKQGFWVVAIILLLVAIDQGSKSFLITYLKTQPGMHLHITSFFSLAYAWNHGISFGLFSSFYQYSNYIFLVVNILVTCYLCFMLGSSHKKTEYYGLVIVIGGALGNIIDRIFRGAVFDFLHFHMRLYSHEYHFPVFNLADAFINIGVMMIMWSLVFCRK